MQVWEVDAVLRRSKQSKPKPQRVLFSENGKPHHTCTGCGKCRSKNSKNLMERQLVDGFAGIYELEDGAIMEAHEWFDSDWSDYDEEPYGAVYYDIYENGEEVDGGVLGYDPGDTIQDLDDFIAGNNANGIKRLIAKEGTDEFYEIYNALGFPDDYAKVKSKYGLTKNSKPVPVGPVRFERMGEGKWLYADDLRYASITKVRDDWYKVEAYVKGCPQYLNYPTSLKKAKAEVQFYFQDPRNRGFNL